jgi:hypothetical protein
MPAEELANLRIHILSSDETIEQDQLNESSPTLMELYEQLM